jgi:hypothetical protein
MKSEIHVIELVTRMVGRNDVGDESSRSPTLTEVVDEQGVECGIVRNRCNKLMTTLMQKGLPSLAVMKQC